MRLSISGLAFVLPSNSNVGHPASAAPAFTFRTLPLLVTLALGMQGLNAHAAAPLPQGGQFVAGSGTIAQNGQKMNITQSGSRGIIDWNSFSIGAGHTVSINNGIGVTLNRVTGTDASAIYGTLKGTGSIYVINPNGVLIGSSGVVTTGGRFVASTLDTDNDRFMQGLQPRVFTGPSNASVVNLGKISSTGGDVLLVSANKVVNAGAIEAPNGTTELAAARNVLLLDSDYGQRVGVQVGSQGTVINSGTMRGAVVSLQAADGNIFALAGNSSVLRATGTTTIDGHVWLVANGGTVDARGALISARNADGSGGTIDTTADLVKVSGASVNAKTWNINAADFSADGATANTLGATLSRGTSITLAAAGADGKFGANGEGDIALLSSIRWIGASSLTLSAAHSITIARQAIIANVGAGSLTLYADAHGFDNQGSVINNGTLDWSRSTGIVAALYDMNGSYISGKVRSNASWSAAPFSGLVTQVTAYQLVNSIADFAAVKNNLAGTYALGKSLELAGASDIGGIGNAANPFTGQFDGMGHAPGDLIMTGAANTGLFGVIGQRGVVRNFVLTSSTASSSNGAAGLLAGTNYGYMVNVAATGVVTSTGGSDSAAGGLVGENFGRIEQSWAGGRIAGEGKVGGLVGQNDGSVIQSYTLGSTVSAGEQGVVGGLVGANNGTIAQSFSRGSVSGGAFFGGIVGSNAGTIRESYAVSTLTAGPGTQSIGGIAGSNSGKIKANVFWNSETSGASAGVGAGTAVALSSGLNSVQINDPASYGPHWDFSPNGVWTLPTYAGPGLRWSPGT